MTAQNKRKIRSKSLRLRSFKWHLMKLAEESAELADAIIKIFTKKHNYDHVYSEIVDVEIMIRTIKDTFDFSIFEKMKNYENEKYERIGKKLKEEEAGEDV